MTDISTVSVVASQIVLWITSVVCVDNIYSKTDRCYDVVKYDTNGTCKRLSYDARALLPERICRYPSGWPLTAEEELEKGSIQPDFLEIRQFGDKGRGIITKVDIPAGSYVIYYHGIRKYKAPVLDDHGESYLFEAYIGRCKFWIDASAEDGSYARLMNDNDLDENIRVEISLKNVLLYADRDIRAGEELTFDYGLSIDEYAWRQLIPRMERKRRREQGRLLKKMGLSPPIVITS